MTSPHKLIVDGGTAQVTRSEIEGIKKNLSQMIFTTDEALAAPNASATVKKVLPFLKKASTRAATLSLIMDGVLATGESLTIVVKRVRGGTASIITTASNIQITSENYTSAGSEKNLSSTIEGDTPIAFAEGDFVECTLEYTAGATPTPVNRIIVRLQFA